LILYVTVAFGVPVNVKVVVPFSQIVLGLAVTLAVGKGKTVIEILLVCGLIQLGVPELATLTILIVPVVVGLTTIVAVPDAFNVIVWFAPPLMLYVTVAFGVPVKVKVVVPFSQIVLGLAVTLAVGNGKTVIGILLVCGLIQLGVPELATLTMFIVPVVVGLTDIVAVPAALKVIVWLVPPLMLYVTVAFGVPVKVKVVVPF
jgi:hypothetical protein